MKAGKLSESVLKRSVLKQLHSLTEIHAGARQDEPEVTIVSRPEIGEDYAAVKLTNAAAPANVSSGSGSQTDTKYAKAGLELPEKSVVSTVATRCLGGAMNPMLSVYAALNNLYCSGAKAYGIMVNLLLPTSANENELREWVQAMDVVCEKEGVAVLGGHTEVVRAVSEPMVTVTALGTVDEAQRIEAGTVKPGMDILITKQIALEGTAILATQHEEKLLGRYAVPFIDRAKRFTDYLSIRSEAAVAAKSGVAAMHDISEGGVFGALWEMGLSSGVGLEIDLKKIPIRQETVEICEFFDINPYKLLSGGAAVIAAADGNALVHALQLAGIEATIVGKATDSNDRVLINGEERRFLETTQTDELFKMKEN